MSNLLSMIESMEEAGLPAEQILAVIKNEQRKKLDKDRLRKRKEREQKNTEKTIHASVDSVDSADNSDTLPPNDYLSKPPSKKNPPKGGQKESSIPDWVNRDAWRGFEDLRRAMHSKHPWTDRARTLALTELEKLKAKGHDPTECINLAVMNGWRSFYEPKGRQEQGTSKAKTTWGV